MMKLFLSVFILIFALNAMAKSEQDIQSAIQYQMHQRHPDLPANFWTDLGTEAVPVLEKLFSASTSSYEQSWLLSGLGHFSDPSIGVLLEDKIKSNQNGVLEKQMLSALIESQGDAAYAFVEPYLGDKDPHIRLAVAKGMKEYLSGAKANTRLAQFQSDETLEWVKKNLNEEASSPRMKRSNPVNGQAPVASSLPQPLLEKDWAGEWRGMFVTGSKTSVANAILTPKNKSWKVEIKLPKQTLYELKQNDLEILYYQSQHEHWIEIRVKKEDSIFLGKREAK